MRCFALVLACLASQSCGKQVEASDGGMKSNKQQASLNPANALMTLLLASNPTLAFNPTGAGARLPVGKPALAASHVPTVSMAEVQVSDQELRESMDKRIAQLGIAHPDVLDTKYALAVALKDSGELKPAEEMLREVIESYTAVLGFDAPDVLKAKDTLADTLKGLGDEKAAEELEEETLKLRTRRCQDGKRGESYWAKIARYSRQVAVIKKNLGQSFVIFCMPYSGLTVALLEEFRNKMPEGTKVNVIKNRLMKRALQDYPGFQAVEPLLEDPRMWVFCTEDSFRATLEAVKEWQQDNKKTGSHPILGGAMDGQLYDADGVDALSKLPSRQELMAKVAVAINSVPTKLARGVKAVPTKLARGIKAVPTKLANGIVQVEEKGKEKGVSTIGDI